MISILTIVLLASVAVADPVVEPPAWPLALDTRYLTGNFMEPRDGRFHSGLDLKTNSRTGYAVVAVRDGWVSRIKYAADGYGKAVYLRGDDGLTYVYGHLGRLADGLRSRVRAEQRRHGAYDVDLTLDAAAFPVARGDVLALSGQSGTSGPHLHFEVRGPDGAPRDPLAHGFAVDDGIAPEILALRVIDLGALGAPSLRWGDGEAPLAGRLPDLFLRHGRVRFAARIVERSDHLRYRLGAWRVRLYLDDREVFTSTNDRLAWRHNRQQRLEYLRTSLGQERWLWQDPRVGLEGRGAAAGFGETGLSPGRHRLRLEATDRAGNRAEVTWLVDVDPGLPADAHSGWDDDEAILPKPMLVDRSGPAPVAGVCEGVSPPLHWRRGRPHQAVAARRMQLAGLEPVTAAVHFSTPGPVLLDPVTVAWPAAASEPLPDPADPTLAVYRLDDGEWAYEAALRDDSSAAVFELDREGVHAILRDVAPPIIAIAPVDTELEPTAERRRHGITLPRWPVVRVPVGDHGSGVDWDTLAVTLDGQPLVVEPDAPRDRILVELPDTLAPGRHELAVAVSDRAGHRSRAAVTLTSRDPDQP